MKDQQNGDFQYDRGLYHEYVLGPCWHEILDALWRSNGGVELISVSDVGSSPGRYSSRLSFRTGRRPHRAIYRIEHNTLGVLDLFRSWQNQTGVRYEAIFNRALE
jgi:hypothetical protein